MKKKILNLLINGVFLGILSLFFNSCSGLQSVSFYDGIYDEVPERFSENSHYDSKLKYFKQKALEHKQFATELENKNNILTETQLSEKQKHLPNVIVNNYNGWYATPHIASPFWGSSVWDYNFYHPYSSYYYHHYYPYRNDWGFSFGNYNPYWGYNYTWGYHSTFYGFSPYHYGYSPYYYGSGYATSHSTRNYSYTQGRRGGDDRYNNASYQKNQTQSSRVTTQSNDYDNRYRRATEPVSSPRWENTTPSRSYSPSYDSGGNMPSRNSSGTTRRDY